MRLRTRALFVLGLFVCSSTGCSDYRQTHSACESMGFESGTSEMGKCEIKLLDQRTNDDGPTTPRTYQSGGGATVYDAQP